MTAHRSEPRINIQKTKCVKGSSDLFFVVCMNAIVYLKVFNLKVSAAFGVISCLLECTESLR